VTCHNLNVQGKKLPHSVPKGPKSGRASLKTRKGRASLKTRKGLPSFKTRKGLVQGKKTPAYFFLKRHNRRKKIKKYFIRVCCKINVNNNNHDFSFTVKLKNFADLTKLKIT
jgi:hypothetical protein